MQAMLLPCRNKTERRENQTYKMVFWCVWCSYEWVAHGGSRCLLVDSTKCQTDYNLIGYSSSNIDILVHASEDGSDFIQCEVCTIRAVVVHDSIVNNCCAQYNTYVNRAWQKLKLKDINLFGTWKYSSKTIGHKHGF